MTLHVGDCREVMASMDAESVDAVVTDPPYELGFMGKGWDYSGVSFDPATWGECWRVLKPGGHLLAFGGTRTYHRLVCAVEDAGFEIRDTIAWMYGSGFPKSLDVSKALDKANGRRFEDRFALGRHIRDRREALGLTRKEVNDWFGYSDGVEHWERQDRSGARVPTAADWAVLADRLGLSDEYWPLVERAEAEREKIGEGVSGATAIWSDGGMGQFDITAPATDEAARWQGWGTALKPAHEPIVVARKPLVGTVAANVSEHGVGGLNIDGCRIGTDPGYTYPNGPQGNTFTVGAGPDGSRSDPVESNSAGRWPANVVLDEEAAALLDQQTGDVGGGYGSTRGASDSEWNSTDRTKSPGQTIRGDGRVVGFGDSGGASRFFYVSKAGREERNAGLNGMEERPTVTAAGSADRCRLCGRQRVNMPGSECLCDEPEWEKRATHTAAANHHPTVKPLDLMRWLVRLVTPPDGLILDPFTGSGSTGIAAGLEGFRFVGIEQDPEYAAIAEARMAHWAQLGHQARLL